jgi:alkylation response protein AidB-like acyl-CoA dehydrogenase
MARNFAEQELLPRADEARPPGDERPEVFERMKELGLWGLTVPEQYAARGSATMALSVVLAEINHSCASTGVDAVGAQQPDLRAAEPSSAAMSRRSLAAEASPRGRSWARTA